MSRTPALRAPTGDGEVLAVPPLDEVADLAGRNRRAAARGPFAEIGAAARRELLGEGDGPSFVAGHQPELFHPGVWVKNFALAGLARRLGGAALNLIVDNDTLKSHALRVPAAGPPARLASVPFDRAGPEEPWEERRVRDPQTFAAFGDEVAALMRGFGIEPLVATMWPGVVRQAGEATIGEAFAEARREVERRWGCRNREVPLSAVSGGEGFARFVGALLADAGGFVATYNAVVRAYRARRRIRSRNHPVPDLAIEGDWLEVPLWGWRAGGGRRGRLFVRPTGRRLSLRAGGEEWPDLPPPGSADFVAAWRALGPAGYKARPRALTTTLFARLTLADVFVHGIGGALYDELTDELMRRHFGAEPPGFLTLSATLLLPLARGGDGADERRRLARLLRDLEYNPQRHLAAGVDEQGRRERRDWVRSEPTTRAGRRERYRRLREANDRLGATLAGEKEGVRRRLADLDAGLAVGAMLGRRDYSFCLYPEATLRPFCQRFL